MSFYPADDDKTRDLIRAKVGPPTLEVGERVWWNGIWGEIFHGRIRRIELGTMRDGYSSWQCRQYTAQAEIQTSSSEPGKSWAASTHWKSERQADPDDFFWTFKLTENDAKKQAIKNLQGRIRDEQRKIDDAQKYINILQEEIASNG